MRLYRAVLAGLFAGLALVVPSAAAQTVAGEPIAVGPFDRLQVSGPAKVVLVQGEAESVTVEGSVKSPARVRVRASDGRLAISVEEAHGWFGGSRHPPTIHVRFRTLQSLNLSGSVKLSAATIATPALRIDSSGATSIHIDELRTDMLRFVGSGAVKAQLAGRATEQVVAISGAGSFRAPNLASDTTKVSVTGAGRATVNARKSLSAEISGAGAIDYYGNPDVKQRVSGAGRITRRASEALPTRT